jgi:hypothetical protein
VMRSTRLYQHSMVKHYGSHEKEKSRMGGWCTVVTKSVATSDLSLNGSSVTGGTGLLKSSQRTPPFFLQHFIKIAMFPYCCSSTNAHQRPNIVASTLNFSSLVSINAQYDFGAP